MSSLPPHSSRHRGWGNLAATLVGAVLVFAAITKILAPKAFMASMDGYGLFPPSLLLFLATGITGLELMLGVLLLTGVYRRAAAWLAFPLMVAFLGLLIYGIRAGLESCGCFAQAVSIPPGVEIAIDVALLVLLVVTLRFGTNLRFGPASLRQGLAWVSLCGGAGWFLAGNPALTSTAEELTIEASQLTVLKDTAQPPVDLGDEAFVFLFSADCDHCWAFASTVENIHRRLPELSVVGVTFSAPDALDTFVRSFAPGYSIHVVPMSVFDSITEEYPAAIWISGGQVEKTWVGFVPSHLELANLGGYTMVEGPLESAPSPATLEDERPPSPESPFGGPASARN